jgi:hypothetical protein
MTLPGEFISQVEELQYIRNSVNRQPFRSTHEVGTPFISDSPIPSSAQLLNYAASRRVTPVLSSACLIDTPSVPLALDPDRLISTAPHPANPSTFLLVVATRKHACRIRGLLNNLIFKAHLV